MSLAWGVYRAAASMVGALAPWAAAFASAPERELWRERMGRVERPGGCHAWIHAASLGEATAVRPLVEGLASIHPRARFHLTATTRTGRARLEALGHPASLAPIDAPQAVRRFVDGVGPERLFLIETELWPHWLIRLRREGVPVAVVSARLSRRSVRRYRRLGAALRRLVAGLDAVLCQSEEDARRWLELGASPERTAVVGNLKDDGLPAAAPDRPAARAAVGVDPGRPLLVLGSLRPGEGSPLARAWTGLPREVRDRWQVVAVPRHARASGDLRAEVTGAGVAVAADGAPVHGAWRWDDRAGVLAGWYAAAEVAFVGGSLRRWGGHNPLEPASVGAAVIMGPHHASQREAVRALSAGGALVEVGGAEQARAALERLLTDDAERRRRAEAGLAVVAARRGAGERAVRELAARRLWPAA